MSPSPVLIALLCFQGAQAAVVLRGNVVTDVVAEKQTSFVSGLVAQAEKIQQSPQAQGAENGSGGSFTQRVILQLIFGLIYYYVVVSKYPMLDGAKPTSEAVKLQELDAVSATAESTLPNCLLSWCCTGPRAAHTFYSTGVLGYWESLCLMSLFPCCTLWAVNSFTDLNERLGGQKAGMFMSAVCACFCSCCVVAQDAQSLDLITGTDTKLCGAPQAH